MALFRRREMGFVFQNFNLLDTITVGENIVLPLTLETSYEKSIDFIKKFVICLEYINTLIRKSSIKRHTGLLNKTILFSILLILVM